MPAVAEPGNARTAREAPWSFAARSPLSADGSGRCSTAVGQDDFGAGDAEGRGIKGRFRAETVEAERFRTPASGSYCRLATVRGGGVFLCYIYIIK